jgi:hypothetical protein
METILSRRNYNEATDFDSVYRNPGLLPIEKLALAYESNTTFLDQGMDPNNERKVFELMVETSTRPNTPQHFLMSPKVRVVWYCRVWHGSYGVVWCMAYHAMWCGIVYDVIWHDVWYGMRDYLKTSRSVL